MKSDIYISTSNFKSKHNNILSEILNNLPEQYNNYEISSGHKGSFKDFELLQVKMEEGFKFLLHNYSFAEQDNLLINLSEMDDQNRNKTIDYIKKMVEFTNKLDSDYFSFHAGWLFPKKYCTDSFSFDKYYNRSIEFFMESLTELNKFGQEYGVKLGIENHVVVKGNENKLNFYSKDDFIKLFQSDWDDNIFLHLDVAHLKVSSQTYGFDALVFIENFKNNIYAVHLHDNNGLDDNHQPFNKESYFINELSDLDELKYLILETWDGESKLDDMIDILFEKLN